MRVIKIVSTLLLFVLCSCDVHMVYNYPVQKIRKAEDSISYRASGREIGNETVFTVKPQTASFGLIHSHHDLNVGYSIDEGIGSNTWVADTFLNDFSDSFYSWERFIFSN